MENDQIDQPASEEKKAPKNPDRVGLGKAESEKVERWLTQINQSSKGFLLLTKSDVVNFLVRQHRDELLSKELVRIRADHYDPIRHINWITPQLKAALFSGDVARVSELQAEIRGIELSVISDATAGRKTCGNDTETPTKRKKPKAKIDTNTMQDGREPSVHKEPAESELSNK